MLLILGFFQCKCCNYESAESQLGAVRMPSVAGDTEAFEKSPPGEIILRLCGAS